MKQLISNRCIYNIIKKSYNGEYENKDDKYQVINFNYLKQKNAGALNTVVSPNESFDNYLMRLATIKDIDPDEYNYLKEVKLRCFNKYLKNYNELDHRIIGVYTYTDINKNIEINESIQSLVFVYAKNMHSYKEYITNDSAFVIFSNINIGGLILTSGCAQEEIKFLQNPELLYLKICQCQLTDNKVIVIDNVKKYNSTIGYGFDVQDIEDTNVGYVETFILMNANDYSSKPWLQYDQENKRKEINKCLTAFSNVKEKNIITGDWGCGAFKGNHELKFLIQLYCAYLCKKNLYYFSYKINKTHLNKYINLNCQELLYIINNYNS